MLKRFICLVVLLALLFSLSGCKQHPLQDELFAKLLGHFEQRGYACTLNRLSDVQPDREVPIYQASAWHSLLLNGEEVLVYFDESNRADYLSQPIDVQRWGHVARFGLRFVLVYSGQDEGIIDALRDMPQ